MTTSAAGGKARKCDICQLTRKVYPDLKHTHMRGRICRRCAGLLALADDQRLVLQWAADYLLVEKYEEKNH